MQMFKSRVHNFLGGKSGLNPALAKLRRQRSWPWPPPLIKKNIISISCEYNEIRDAAARTRALYKKIIRKKVFKLTGIPDPVGSNDYCEGWREDGIFPTDDDVEKAAQALVAKSVIKKFLRFNNIFNNN